MDGRIGQFFILVGLAVLFAFVASYQAGEPDALLALIGLGATGLGIFIRIKKRRPPGEPQYFRRLRKLRSKKKKK